MNKNKKEIISKIKEYFKKGYFEIDYCGVFGSFVRKKNYRDIDLLIVIPETNERDIKLLETLLKNTLSTSIDIPFDYKIYTNNKFTTDVIKKTELLLSIATEIETIVPNEYIESFFPEVISFLSEKGIKTISKEWIVSDKLIYDIANPKNARFRGFLVSHIDLISSKKEIAYKLLESLAPINEPYTRIACLKCVLRLINNEKFRQSLNISLSQSLNLASIILDNRKIIDWASYEDYSTDDLCLLLVQEVEKIDSTLWKSIAKNLISKLLKDKNHIVRGNTIKFTLNKVFDFDIALGLEFLSESLKFEYKIQNSELITDNLKIDIDKEGLLRIVDTFLNLNEKLLEYQDVLIWFKEKLNDLKDTSRWNKLIGVYLIYDEFLKAIVYDKNNLIAILYLIVRFQKNKIVKEVTEGVLYEQKFDIELFQEIEMKSGKRKEIVSNWIKKFRKFNEFSPAEVGYYSSAYEIQSIFKKSMMIIPSHLDLLKSINNKVKSFIDQEIKKVRLSNFFSVIAKPRFGLKVNRENTVVFDIENITDLSIPNVHVEFQSSAEVTVNLLSYNFKSSIKPGETKQLKYKIIPNYGKQIAISYKINEQFGEPIYLSADRENPFIPNSPAKNAHFVGRQKEIAHILEEIHQQNFLIFGPRRIGKTSFLFQLEEELKEGFIPVYLSLQSFPDKDGIDLYNYFIEFVMEQVNSIIDLENDDYISNIRFLPEEERLVLLIDEMDVLAEKNDYKTFLEKLRELSQTQSNIKLVMSSGPFITKDLTDSSSPLFNMATPIAISKLSFEESEKLIRLVEDINIQINEESVALCCQWSGGLPLYLQIIGNAIFQRLKNKEESSKVVDNNLLREIFHELRNDSIELGKFWDIIDDMQKAIISIIVHEKDIIDNKILKKKLEYLSNKKISFQFIKEAQKNLVWNGIVNADTPLKINSKLVDAWFTKHISYPEEVEELLEEI